MKKDGLGCILVIVSLIASSLWSGFVLSILWGWFIAATFDIQTIGIAPAIGLSLVVRYLTYQQAPTDTSKTSTERVIEALVVAFLQPTFALAFGWLVHQFM